MTNPFAALNISDDDDEQPKVNIVKGENEKHRKTNQQRKEFKKKKQAQLTKTNAPVSNSIEAPDSKEKQHHYRHMQKDKTQWKHKQLTDGHTHDRRSGTGRTDKVRKEGGGYGNVGNQKDLQNQDKYVKEPKQVEEVEEESKEQPKPEEPQALTLDEYYKQQGRDVNYKVDKAPVKKGTVENVDWIKKEKLTVIQTKEDKKIAERINAPKAKVSSHNVGLQDKNLELLGFGSKPVPKKQQPEVFEKKDDNRKGGRKGPKVQLKAEDFPSL